MPYLRSAPAPVTANAGHGAELAASGLALSYGATRVLDGVDLRVPAGAVVALLGPSGCGKTTLLRTLSGLERPSAGEVRLAGRTLTGDDTFVAPERRRIGMVFQDWALFPHMTVGRNVGFGLSREERRAGGVERALELVELPGFAARTPSTLSGGQQQRVALARALANRPDAILLDEPFSNLDATLRTQVRGEVIALLRSLGVTALFVTHDQEEAFVLGDEVAVMLGGRIEQQAAPAELYHAPATLAVARFVGDANLLSGQAEGASAATPLGRVPLTGSARGAVDVLVRPEFVEVSDGDDAQVVGVEYYGHDAVYLVRPDAGVTLRARILSSPVYRPGDRVTLGYTGNPTAAYPRG